MYPAGGQGRLYPYCTGSDPDGSGNRGGTGTEKRTDISSADFQEEIAEKLRVTEEYLSTQFRKETGRTFTETIRGYRIERIKELLTATNWKLTKIAELAGYTDPKYMSRVFKEETGMLPLEYRKKNG